ncbi:LytTR family DNA-binding domain-containing protein [Candidatus Chlorohelix sp.]|uniref:LytR/AlgR family response regulator transcription factor n=1 Tax=Candidatus Chlorohelix sp. TaxID=3139201 RepID=UPI0030454027
MTQLTQNMPPTKPGFRALVVDDERPALEELSYMLDQSGYCSRIDTTSEVLEALKFLKEKKYDIIFVDVQMPGLTGLELVHVLRQFASPPKVVFVTAFDDYAVQAFELDAVDYLLKPFSKERLEQALQRAARRPGDSPVVESDDDAYSRKKVDAPPGEKLLEKLPVDKEGKTILIDLADIRFAVARGDYVYIKTLEQEYLTRYSISELERRLPSPPFLRTHRAFLVNLKNVIEIYPFFNGAYVLKVNDRENSEVQVSRGNAKNLRALLGM